jgi:hypothetical protein
MGKVNTRGRDYDVQRTIQFGDDEETAGPVTGGYVVAT